MRGEQRATCLQKPPQAWGEVGGLGRCDGGNPQVSVTERRGEERKVNPD